MANERLLQAVTTRAEPPRRNCGCQRRNATSSATIRLVLTGRLVPSDGANTLTRSSSSIQPRSTTVLADVAGRQRVEQRRVLAFDVAHLGQLVEVFRRVLGQLVEPPFDAVDVAQHVGEAVLAVGDDEPVANQPGQVSPHVGNVRRDGGADQLGQAFLDVGSEPRRSRPRCARRSPIAAGSWRRAVGDQRVELSRGPHLAVLGDQPVGDGGDAIGWRSRWRSAARSGRASVCRGW